MAEILCTFGDRPEADKKEILRYAGCREADAETVKLLDRCLEKALPLIRPALCSRLISVGEFKTGSKTLSKYLSGFNSFVVFAATVGSGIDRLIKASSDLHPAESLMYQAIGTQQVEAVCDSFCESLCEKYRVVKPRISPGFGDMDLSMQKEIMQILSCSSKIGLTLTDSMIMFPSKSVTAFVGVKE